jgi:hypothetical protein
MNTLILGIVTVLAWFALEFWRVLRGESSISQQIQGLYKVWPTVGMLFGLITGLLLAHWFFP